MIALPGLKFCLTTGLKCFLLQEEDLSQPQLESRAQPHQAAIKVTNGSFAWSEEADLALRDINLEVLEGQLLMIVGEVGSGKSSLLNALLGELSVRSGGASVRGNATPCQGSMGVCQCMLLSCSPLKQFTKLLGLLFSRMRV